MNEKKKTKLPKEIEDFLKAYAEWYERNKPEANNSNPNDPPPPPPGPIKP